MTRRARADFDEFVAVCSGRLQRLAEGLTGDAVVAARLLEWALARTWVDWRRLDAQPEPFARGLLVRGFLAGRGQRRSGLGRRRARRRRAVAVLRRAEGLSEEQVADLVGCSVATVRDDEARADETSVDPTSPSPGPGTRGPQVLSAGVDRRVEEIRAQRRLLRGFVAMAGCLVVVVALVAGPDLVPDRSGPSPGPPTTAPSRLERPPPLLAGRQLPRVVREAGVGYEYYSSIESHPGDSLLRMTVSASRQPQAVVWVSPPTQGGQVVLRVDGQQVGRSRAGGVGGSVLLSARRTHQVVLRATGGDVASRLGIAVYRWPEP